MEFDLPCELSDNKFMKIKRILIASLWCLVAVSCAGKQETSIATPEMTTEHISGWVVYSATVSQEPFVAQIFLENLDTGEITQLTSSGHNRFPKWSPDGSKIVFVSLTKENREDIYIMNKDGSDQAPIVATPADELMPDWSPDGKQVVYSSYTRDNISEIYLIDIVTKNIKRLTSTTEWAYSPTWSVDGELIAFTSGQPDSKSQIYAMNNDGTDVRRITNEGLGYFNHSPVWCPNDSCIVFNGGDGGSELLLLDLNSLAVSPLLSDVFKSGSLQILPERSSIRGYITFIVGEMSYAMDMKTKKIYSLGVANALDISLYP